MSYASGTTHYNLPQTVGSDKRDWTDTNQAFSDIDAAIYGAAQGASAATSAIETINGEIETITGKQAVDEGNISTLSGKVSTLESTVGTQGAAIADVRQDLQDNIESKREASATSTHAYNVGDTFYYNDVLYKATAQIAIGGTIVPSTNCTAVTVMSELQAISGENTPDIEYTATANMTGADVLAWIRSNLDFDKITPFTKIDLANAIYTVYSVTPNLCMYCIGTSSSGCVATAFLTNRSDIANNRFFSESTDVLATTQVTLGATIKVYY